MQFEFATATRIIFGPGTLKEAGPLAAGLGHRAFVVTRVEDKNAQRLLDRVQQAGLETTRFTVESEPTLDLVREGTARARAAGCDLVIGCGGGSVLDAGKAVAALLANGGDPLDYVEVIGRGAPLKQPAVPYLAIPTTAGTGAEVTRNAVLTAPDQQVKVSLRSPGMLPKVALVDPELTYQLPPAVTASTGLDALTQLIEPYVSVRANAMTDGFCREGLPRAARSLVRAYEQGDDTEAREDMALASLFGGLALANAGLGAAHGFAAPLGGMFAAPHGALCACLLPYVMAVNIRALEMRQPDSRALRRYIELGALLTGDLKATAVDGVQWVSEVAATLQIPALSRYGLTAAQIPLVAEKAAEASSMKGNPLPLTADELQEILYRAL